MEKDKLDILFEMQDSLDKEIEQTRNLGDISKEMWIQKETLAMLSELAELIDEVNFKWWKNPKEIDETKIKGELIDILHFFMSMCLKMGMTAEEVYNIYVEKNKENFDRQHGKSKKPGYDIEQFNNTIKK